jgi:hypothetical protein
MMFEPMQFDEKARENLEAVDRLLPDDDGERSSLPNAVANRAYYAAYSAVAHCAQQKGIEFTSADRGYYRHDSLPDDAARHGILDDEGRRDLVQLRNLRVKADYWEDPVDIEEADEVAVIAKRLVKGLIG